MTDPLDVLRDIGESEVNPSCGMPYKETLKDKIRNFNLRKLLGRKILGNKFYGKGILVQVDLSHKTKEEVNAFWKALKLLRGTGTGSAWAS